MSDIREIKMTDSEAIKVINRIRGCFYTRECGMQCESCPSNFTEEELHEALGIATKYITMEILIEEGKEDWQK